jgi:hypothetical protein
MSVIVPVTHQLTDDSVRVHKSPTRILIQCSLRAVRHVQSARFSRFSEHGRWRLGNIATSEAVNRDLGDPSQSILLEHASISCLAHAFVHYF